MILILLLMKKKELFARENQKIGKRDMIKRKNIKGKEVNLHQQKIPQKKEKKETEAKSPRAKKEKKRDKKQTLKYHNSISDLRPCIAERKFVSF